MMNMTNQKNIVLHFDYLPCVNYAALSCGVETCNTFIIENHDTKDWHNIKGSELSSSSTQVAPVSSRHEVPDSLEDVGIVVHTNGVPKVKKIRNCR